MAQNRQNDKIPRAENYTMYSAFSTDAHAAEHAQRKANREKAQQGAKREYHTASYAVRRAQPKKPLYTSADDLPNASEAVFGRPRSEQQAARKAANLTPAAPSEPRKNGYVQVYGGEKGLQAARLPTFRVVTKQDPVKKPFPLTLVIGAVICTALLIFFIYNFVVLSEYTKNVSSLNSTLTRLKQQQSTLELQLVQRDDLNEIEDYVSDRLGMIKAEGTQKKYITTVSGDKTVVITKDTKKEIPKQSVSLED